MTLFLYLSGYALFLAFTVWEIRRDQKRGWPYYAIALLGSFVWFILGPVRVYQEVRPLWLKWRVRRG